MTTGRIGPMEFGKAMLSSGRNLNASGSALRKLLELAIEGAPGMPGARAAAATQLGRRMDREHALDSLAAQHVMMAGAQGFATNIGGVLAAMMAVPANLAGLSVIQCRLVATIAHLRGYDLDDPRVRTAILVCLLGEARVKELVEDGDLPSTPMGIATAPAHDPALDSQVSDFVMGNLLSQVGGKKLPLLLGKRIPVLGGGVGAATDSYQTHVIGAYARQQFVDRRRITR